MSPNPQEAADLVTFTEEIFNGRLHFLCSTGHRLNVSKIFRRRPERLLTFSELF